MTIDEKSTECILGFLKLPHLSCRRVDALYQELKKE